MSVFGELEEMSVQVCDENKYEKWLHVTILRHINGNFPKAVDQLEEMVSEVRYSLE